MWANYVKRIIRHGEDINYALKRDHFYADIMI